MSEFYRFLRPQQLHLERNAIEAMPNGGVCLRARTLDSALGGLFVGISVCPHTELFNRAVAKKKAEDFDWYVNPKSFSAEDIINELLENPVEVTCMLAPILDPEESVWDKLRAFNTEVQWIRENRKQVRQFQQNHHDAVKALQLGARYNELQS